MLQRMDEELHLSKKLKMNGYPQRFICKQQKRRSSKPDEPRNELKATVTLPYVRGLSELIKRINARGGGHQSEVQAKHDSEEAIGQAQRPSSSGVPNWDCLPNPLQELLSGVRWPIRPYNY